MFERAVYLAKSRRASSMRWHFGLVVPDAASNRKDLAQGWRNGACKATVIHVVGEPLMAGYALEIKRNCDLSTYQELQELVPLGYVKSSNLFDPPADGDFVSESTPRAPLEREAAKVPPPPRGQDLRAPVDGVRIESTSDSRTLLTMP